jgi:ribosomal protein S14
MMYEVEPYLRVRRACMVDGMSTREAFRVFGLHRDPVRKMLTYGVPQAQSTEKIQDRPVHSGH